MESAAWPAPGLACPNPAHPMGTQANKGHCSKIPLLLLPVLSSFQEKCKGQPHTSQHGKNLTLSQPKTVTGKASLLPACDQSRLPWTAPRSPPVGKTREEGKNLQHDVCGDRALLCPGQEVPWKTFPSTDSSLSDVSRIYADKNTKKFSFTGLKLHLRITILSI